MKMCHGPPAQLQRLQRSQTGEVLKMAFPGQTGVLQPLEHLMWPLISRQFSAETAPLLEAGNAKYLFSPRALPAGREGPLQRALPQTGGSEVTTVS